MQRNMVPLFIYFLPRISGRLGGKGLKNMVTEGVRMDF